MQVAIFTPDASNLEAYNTTASIINACVQAKSGESMNVIRWEVLGPNTIVSELIPLGDGPYKLTLTINRPRRKNLCITITDFAEDKCVTVIIKDDQGRKVNYMDGTQLTYQLHNEFQIGV